MSEPRRFGPAGLAGAKRFLSDEVADALRLRIERGELAPGQRLPSLRDLAGEYHAAVGTVVRAIGMLKREGFLVTGPARGTFVCLQS